MDKRKIIKAVEKVIQAQFKKDTSGHDWWHIDRVRKTAKHIAKSEGGDLFVIELAALLHDISDWKFNGGDDKAGARVATKLLVKLKVPESITEQVAYIIDHISFKLGINKHKMQTIEGKIVQDADRLDAIGAIGIARVFAFGGSRGRAIYDPTISLAKYKSMAQAKKTLGSGTSINHFYEKLLLVKGKMNTKTGKKMATHRHKLMEQFLKEFFSEWDGKR